MATSTSKTSSETYTMSPQEMSAALNKMQLDLATAALAIATDAVTKLDDINNGLVLDPAYTSAVKQAVTSLCNSVRSSINFVLPDIIKNLTPPPAPLVLPTPDAPTA